MTQPLAHIVTVISDFSRSQDTPVDGKCMGYASFSALLCHWVSCRLTWALHVEGSVSQPLAGLPQSPEWVKVHQCSCLPSELLRVGERVVETPDGPLKSSRCGNKSLRLSLASEHLRVGGELSKGLLGLLTVSVDE